VVVIVQDQLLCDSKLNPDLTKTRSAGTNVSTEAIVVPQLSWSIRRQPEPFAGTVTYAY